ncbi:MULTISPECIES: hypothetical protein [Streptomyces]|uniref:Uncharacterized protein n=1 Tax=Streptomyces luteosporeus TaxID=173856 RepID=A0ABP6GDM7_9ACTN
MSAPHLDPDAAGDVAAKGSSQAWRQRVSAHIAHLQAQMDRITTQPLQPEDAALAKKANAHLAAARNAVNYHSRSAKSATIDRIFSNIHKAEVKIVRLVPRDELRWYGMVVLAQARQHLGSEDPRLRALESELKTSNNQLGLHMRELAISTLLAAHDAEETERARVRSFRNILLISVIATGLIAAGFVIWGYAAPHVVPRNLCFEQPPTPDNLHPAVACPVGPHASGRDVLLVELSGLGAAALAGAISLRDIQGTTTPYSVPMMLILLRLPVGALAALFGIFLIHGGVVPGLTALDNGPQIVAWAVIFGVLQESVTRLIDRQGKKVLDSARDSTRGVEAK